MSLTLVLFTFGSLSQRYFRIAIEHERYLVPVCTTLAVQLEPKTMMWFIIFRSRLMWYLPTSPDIFDGVLPMAGSTGRGLVAMSAGPQSSNYRGRIERDKRT
jgi:hypothetical protein